MTQDDPLARFFYETECIKGTWSVKELRRQIATNLYFRSGVSKDPKKLLNTINGKKMMEYAIAGMNNHLFVSTYMLQLPDMATLEKFLMDEIGKEKA